MIDATAQALLAHHPTNGLLTGLQYHGGANRVQMTDGRIVWIGSLFSQLEETPVEVVATFDDATGVLLRYEENNTGWFRRTQERWEAVYGAYGLWPLETQVLFDMLYSIEVTHTVPGDQLLSETIAYELALQAAGLTQSRDTLHAERALVHDPYATTPAEQYVWMMTLCLDSAPLAQVNISAVDATVLEVFDLSDWVG